MLKLLDGATENYLFEEISLLKQIGGFHEKIEHIFKQEWHSLEKEDILMLIKLHESLNEFTEPIISLDEARSKLSKELQDVINELHSTNEVLVSNLE